MHARIPLLRRRMITCYYCVLRMVRWHAKKFVSNLNLDWDGFSAAVESAPVGNHGGFMLPWFDTEIVPKVLSSRYPSTGPGCRTMQRVCVVELLKARCWQCVCMPQQAGLQPAAIRATGGASANRSLLQIMADVFQCPVDVCEISNGAALGAAIACCAGD